MPRRARENQASAGNRPFSFSVRTGVNRVIEIGPAATLRNMAARTLASGEFGDAAARELLFWDRDDENVFYEVRESGLFVVRATVC